MRRAALPLALLAATGASAQNSRPQPAPIVDTVPPPRDTPYPGTIRLDVDATDVAHGIFTTRETIPVAKAGALTLLFPKWLPGKHGPRGEIEKLAGLHITAGGRELAWTRDPLDVFAFHVTVPAGAREIVANFQFLSATKADQGGIVFASQALRLQPYSVSLYPAGYFTRDIPVAMKVTYPDGWTAVGAVRAKKAGATYTYDATDYETLVDSPIIAGRYFKAFPLSDKVTLDVVADDPRDLEARPEQIAAHARVVDQAVKLFGAQHYDHYDYLVTISDELGGIGLEHHRSTEINSKPGYWAEWDSRPANRDVYAHEYTHSWDGKFRRGADLWTPDFRTPMRGSLLWVYEGQTQFWGNVLAARAGLVTKQEALDSYAATMAALDNSRGRTWRPMGDTTLDPVITARGAKGWASEQLSETYYQEGLLIWMEVDSILRRESHGTKSIDDFARAFFGLRDGDWGEVTYTFDDIVRTLNGIQPYDWGGLLDKRVNQPSERAPLDGFVNNGYRLVFADTPTPWFAKNEKTRGLTDLSYSLGMVLTKDAITQVTWDGPAFKAGLALGRTVVAVNDLAYTDARLKDAVRAARAGGEPIRLLVKSGERVAEVSIPYRGGPRYPRLEKIGTGEGGLDRLLAPR